MSIHKVITSQFLASLEMLEEAIEKCPDSLWNNENYKTQFWHVAYHTLFYTHLYLQAIPSEFTAWENHRDEYEFLGPLPWPPHKLPKIGEPYQKPEILEYLKFCKFEVNKQIPNMDWESDSGFDWLPFNKLELQFYNIRHLMQHTGELCERLGFQENIEVNWITKL